MKLKFSKIKHKSNIIQILNKFETSLSSLSNNKDNIYYYSEKFYKYGEVWGLYLQDSTLKLVGFVAFYANDFNKKIVYISMIAIDPTFRKLGYATILLEYLEKLCIKKDMKFMKLEVDVNNKVALNLYKNFGFEIVNKSDNNKYYLIKSLLK
ncbi:MAG: GNAT family N-acetyltransferase [Sphaerochaetaceae bacterium]|nr:GNAT family N-acetyltransferase [Sphaerochaetaceae bacterium]